MSGRQPTSTGMGAGHPPGVGQLPRMGAAGLGARGSPARGCVLGPHRPCSAAQRSPPERYRATLGPGRPGQEPQGWAQGSGVRDASGTARRRQRSSSGSAAPPPTPDADAAPAEHNERRRAARPRGPRWAMTSPLSPAGAGPLPALPPRHWLEPLGSGASGFCSFLWQSQRGSVQGVDSISRQIPRRKAASGSGIGKEVVAAAMLMA